MRRSADQNNYKYEHFLRSVLFHTDTVFGSRVISSFANNQFDKEFKNQRYPAWIFSNILNILLRVGKDIFSELPLKFNVSASCKKLIRANHSSLTQPSSYEHT